MIIEFPIIITLMEKSADFLFKKLKLKTFVKTGLQEYDFNHFIGIC